MKTIVINNPAARSSGALTILTEFLEKITKLKCNRKFIVIVSIEELKKYETDRVKIFVIKAQNFKERILWDNFQLKTYLKIKEIKPDLFLSIQNTGVNLDKAIPQIIYYHQALSVTDLKWNFFKKNQRLYWMYKNIYPIFIRQHLNKVKKVIVQTEWVREKFSEKFNYSKKNIILLKPEVKKIVVNSVGVIPKTKFRIFYPATPLIYKNHKIIIEALSLLKKEKPNLIQNIECVFTFNKEENLKLEKLIKDYELKDTIKLIGKISYEKVLEYYKSSDLLVFPSYLETFGLPLLEAQQFDLDILAIELPYSIEVTKNYKKINFIKKNNKNEWKEKIWKQMEKKYNI